MTLLKNKHTTRNKLLLLAFFIFIGLINILPYYFTNGLFPGIDLGFHAARVLSLENIFTSPVNLNYWQHGNNVNTFYPWLTIYPAYVFYLLTNSIQSAFLIYYALISSLTAFIAYWTSYKLYRHREMALAFAIIYTFCGYRVVNMFVRGALGEVVGMSILPLVFLGLVYILLNDYKKWYVLTIALVLLAYSHILSTYTAFLITLMFSGVAFLTNDKKPQRLFALIKAGVVSILLTLPSTIPLIYASKTQDLFSPLSHLAERGSWGLLHLFENSIKNWYTNYATIGLSLVILLLLGLVFFRRLDGTNKGFLIVSILILIFSTNITPWGIVGKFPPIAIFQFTFRFLAIPSLLLAFAGSVALYKLKSKVVSRSILAIALVLTVATSIYYYDDERTSVSKIYMARTMAGWVQGGKSQRNGLSNLQNDKEKYQHIDYLFNAYRWNIKIWETGTDKAIYFYEDGKKVASPNDIRTTADTYSFTYTNTKNAKTLTIPMQNYNEASTFMDGKPIFTKTSKYGTINIKIPQGKHNILITYKHLLLWKICVAISLSALVFFIVYLLWKKRRNCEKGTHLQRGGGIS